MFYLARMDWDFAIERNREGLLGAVAGLLAKIGLAEGSVVERLSRPLYRLVLGRLQAAEAAVRRLIIIMARDIVVEPRPKRPAPKRPVSSCRGQAKDEGKSRPPSFQLCDPQKRADAGRGRRRRKSRKSNPRVTVLNYDPRIPEPLRSLFSTSAPPPPAPQHGDSVKDNTVSARRLCRRLFAIIRALEDLPRQARRYARWLGQPVEDRRPRRERALRFGRPPGWRSRSTHEVHEILKECHWLISELPEPDTS